MAHYTERERAILDSWPKITAADIEAMNDLFRHYLFFRKRSLMGLDDVEVFTSCCGRREILPVLPRTETPEYRALLDGLTHRNALVCPWCGRTATAINLSKAGKRKSLKSYACAVLLHGDQEYLYADAVALSKDYKSESQLTAKPEYWLSSMYRFGRNEVIQFDGQGWGDKFHVTYEQDKLGREKRVKEPFKSGCVSWCGHESYYLLNQELLDSHPFFRWSRYLHDWTYRPGGSRGYLCLKSDFVSYMTAYSIYPRQVEMLLKVGMYAPIMDLVFERKKNADSMCWEETDPKKAFGLDKWGLAWFMAVQPPMEVLAIKKRAKRWFGKDWNISFCTDFLYLWGSDIDNARQAMRLCRQYKIGIDQFLRYMDRQFSRNDLYYADLLDLYVDYLDAAYNLGRCLEHSAVLFPDDLSGAHDEATTEWIAEQTRQHMAELNRTHSEKVKNLKQRRLKYEFELDGLKIVFPLTGSAIRREGKVLSHCVGGYAGRHLNDTLSIVFLRRADRPTEPYVTIEMRGNSIQQIHGYNNERTACAANPTKQSPRVLHKVFLDAWLAWLKKGSPRNEDGTPRLPKPKKTKEARTA